MFRLVRSSISIVGLSVAAAATSPLTAAVTSHHPLASSSSSLCLPSSFPLHTAGRVWRLPTTAMTCSGGGALALAVRYAASASTTGGSSASGSGTSGSASSSSGGKDGHSGSAQSAAAKQKTKKTKKIIKKVVRRKAGGGSGGSSASSASGGGGGGGGGGGHSSSHSHSSGGNGSPSSVSASPSTGNASLSRGSNSSGHHGGGNASSSSSLGNAAGSASSSSSSAAVKAKKKKKQGKKGGGGGGNGGSSGGGASARRQGKAGSVAQRKAAATTSAGGKLSSSGGRSTAAGSARTSRGSNRSTRTSSGNSSSSSGSKKKGRGGGGGGGGGGSSARRGGSRSASSAVARSARKKKLRVCVLNSSYDGADSATAAVDNFLCTPEHYAKKDKKKYSFVDVSVKKIDSYRKVRELVTSNKHDVFFNLCDGGRDEKRAGVDVVQALEEMNAAFTGTDSRSFEPSKIDMKLLVGSCGVRVPNFVLLENEDSLARKCRHLRFPVIVKHLSGYASVGIHKDNRCDDLDQLKKKVPAFIKEFNHALVEEFIRGREGTVLACADAASPHGVKVFKPLMFNFLKDGDDFAYFDKKWGMTCDDTAYGFLPHSDPAYATIVEMARNAYKYIMNGVGYGRVDFRIDERTGEPCFLEINPNCGMWYSEKDGGDFADIMVQDDPTWSHERFLANAVTRALREQAARKPWYFISHDKTGQFSTRASRTVPAGKCLFADAAHPIPVVSKALYKLGAEEASVGCVICRGDGISQAVAIRHSCEPNMQFVHSRTLLFAAKRQINVGEELTVDYGTLRDERMPAFACSCGTVNCRSVIFAMPATARTLEPKAARKLLREKKRQWVAEKEAERLLKKRTASASLSSSASSAASSAASGGAGGSGSGGSGGGSSSSSGGASSSSSSSSGSGGSGHGSK